jgi:hypothetical protein
VSEEVQNLVQQIQGFDRNILYDKAQSAREQLLDFAGAADERDFRCAVEFLAKEKIAVRGVDDAKKLEPFYSQLCLRVRDRLEPDDSVIALAERKLAKIYYIQSRVEEAIVLVEKALLIFSVQLGKNSDQAIEAVTH